MLDKADYKSHYYHVAVAMELATMISGAACIMLANGSRAGITVISLATMVSVRAFGTVIMSRMRVEQSLADSERRFRTLARHAPVGIVLADSSGLCTFVNEAMCAMTGRTPLQMRGEKWLSAIHFDDRQRIADSWHAFLQAGGRWQNECRLSPDHGQLRWIVGSAAELFDDEERLQGYVLTASDITQQKGNERRTLEQSLHDPLTALPNRAYFLQRLDEMLSENSHTHLAVIFLDLDGFKGINDTHGHAIGDTLLKRVAERMMFCIADLPGKCAEGAFAARLGGDEFTMLLQSVSIEQARQIAQRLIRTLAEAYTIQGMQLFVRASAGVAHGMSTESSAEEIIRSADSAMYRAKSEGKGQVEIFSPGERRNVKQVRVAPSDVRLAIEAKEFELEYQPVMNIHTQETWCLEALVRWNCRRHGNVPPLRLVALAEENGLTDSLGRRVLDMALDQLKIWRRIHPKLAVSLNISGHQLLDGEQFVSMIRTGLYEHELPAEALILEVTENIAIGDGSLHSIKKLRSLGMRIFLDDFGASCFGLTTLRRLPLDGVKLDPYLLSGAQDQDRHAAIVRSMIHLAHNLSIDIIAKGVESPAQLQFLRAIGCPSAQGYTVAPPMNASRITNYLAHHGSRERTTLREAA